MSTIGEIIIKIIKGGVWVCLFVRPPSDTGVSLWHFRGFESPSEFFNFHFFGSNFRLSVVLQLASNEWVLQLASNEWVNPAEDSVLAVDDL